MGRWRNLEEIVGDISDSTTWWVAACAPSRGSVVVDGSVPIRDHNRAMGLGHLPDEERPTIAGW